MGEELVRFEEEVARYLGVEYAVGCTSGTDAIFLALRALGVKPGQEVATTPFTFFGTISPILNIGAIPRFVDIDPNTYQIDVNAVEKALRADSNHKIAALLPVHLFGQPADMDGLVELSGKYSVPIVEDAAQAIGSSFAGKKVGGIGDVGCFSFYPTKTLGGLGEGGLVTTRSPEIAGRLKLLRTHGGSKTYYHKLVGSNFRLDTLQAAFLRVFLPHLDSWIERKRSIANYYDQKLCEWSSVVAIPKRLSKGVHTFHQYTLRIKRGTPGSLREHLLKDGIASAVYYPVPCHLQEAVDFLNLRPGSFPEAELAADQVISLPIFPELRREEQDVVIQSVRKWVETL